MNDAYVSIAGSERSAPLAEDLGAADSAEQTTVTIVLRAHAGFVAPHAQVAARLSERTYLTREQLAAQRGASAADIAAVERFVSAAKLTVVEASSARRSIVVAGTIGSLCAAFHVDLRRFRSPEGEFRGRVGAIAVPASLAGVITGVFGLDERPQARAQFRIAHARAVRSSFTPLELGQLYGFPADADGKNQSIALIELGGGYKASDLTAYFAKLGVAEPAVVAVGVDGGKNDPTGDANSADGEVDLDIEVAGALAPAARIVVYFAPNTDQGFLDAITTATHDDVNKPTVISISWGSAEANWTQQAMTNFDAAFADAAALGITVCAAAGDGGSSDGATDGKAHVDFPASSPHVLACGGTSLTADAQGIASETVWNTAGNGATGGGISDVFPLPAWQAHANVPPSQNAGARVGRGVPDVAGDADPQTGYAVLIDGSDTVLGGTSAVAPLWAALVARLNQTSKKPLGLLQPLLYANAGTLRDITTGSNGAYSARAGWDPCTGLGSPDGAKLHALIQKSGK